jgi:hypothetical protein
MHMCGIQKNSLGFELRDLGHHRLLHIVHEIPQNKEDFERGHGCHGQTVTKTFENSLIILPKQFEG